jgi:hypothetical protein
MIEYILVGVFIVEVIAFLLWCVSKSRMDVMWEHEQGGSS